MVSPRKIRESILANKGLRIEHTSTRKSRVVNSVKLDKTDTRKNSLMQFVEAQLKVPIEDLIWSDSVPKVALRTGISSRTISRWRVRFPKENNNGT